MDRRFVQMTEVGCRLPWLVPQNHHVGVDEPKGVNDDLQKQDSGEKKKKKCVWLFLELKIMEEHLHSSGQSPSQPSNLSSCFNHR